MTAFINVGIALNEFILSIETQIEDQTQVLVFFMKYVKKLYQVKLSYLYAFPDFIDNVHVSRLKRKFSKEFLVYLKKKKGKSSMLSLDGGNRGALVKASKNSITDENYYSARIIIRKSMF